MSDIPSPPDTTTARPAVQCCAVPFPTTGCTVPCKARRHMASATRTVLSCVLLRADTAVAALTTDDDAFLLFLQKQKIRTLDLAARAVGPARHLGRLDLLLRPKGDTQREGSIDAAARGCGWRCGCARNGFQYRRALYTVLSLSVTGPPKITRTPQNLGMKLGGTGTGGGRAER
jgi:hypothetical protein